jgi:hypothetical protein
MEVLEGERNFGWMFANDRGEAEFLCKRLAFNLGFLVEGRRKAFSKVMLKSIVFTELSNICIYFSFVNFAVLSTR